MIVIKVANQVFKTYYVNNSFVIGNNVFYDKIRFKFLEKDIRMKDFDFDEGIHKLSISNTNNIITSKLLSEKINNFAVIDNKIYYTIREQKGILIFDIEKKEISKFENYIGLKDNLEGLFDLFFHENNKSALMIKDNKEYLYNKIGWKYAKDLVLVANEDEGGNCVYSQTKNFYVAYDSLGIKKWSIHIDKLLDLDINIFLKTSNYVFVINHEFFVFVFRDPNLLLAIDNGGNLLWSRADLDMGVYNYKNENLYGVNRSAIIKIDIRTGKTLGVEDISESYISNKLSFTNSAIYIFDTMIFVPSSEDRIRFAVFDETTLQFKCIINLESDKPDELIHMPSGQYNHFVYVENKIIIRDSSYCLRIFEINLN